MILVAASLHAAPPTDPTEEQVYEHNKQWLSTFPPAFIATNIRGRKLEYKERRQAALDLLVEKNSRSEASALLVELKKNSFLSDQLCEVLGKWKYRKAIPVLTQIKNDSKRPADVRQAAEKALEEFTRTNDEESGPPVITTN
jgi:hypothetical protein